MKKEDVQKEYKLYRRYVQHLQFNKLQEQKIPKIITVNLNRKRYTQIIIKVKQNHDLLPLKTDFYKSIPSNIRLQNPVPVLLEKLTPLSIKIIPSDESDEHLKIIEQSMLESCNQSKYSLRNEQKLFLELFLDQYIGSYIQCVFELEIIAQALEISLDQVQSFFLQKQQQKFNKFGNQIVKYQFVRFNRYFCPICNLYMCSLHYSSKNQRVYIEREPEEESRIQVSQIDNYYETEFKPNQQHIRDSVGRYKLLNKQELEFRCCEINQCGKFSGNGQKMKKYQQKCIEQMMEFGFSNCCFMYKVLQHYAFELTCNQINYYLKTHKSQIPKQIKQKQKQLSQKQVSNYQQQYIPCFHVESCNSADCSCTLCNKYCCCQGNCEKKLRSCDCKKCEYDDVRQKFSCPCFNAGQECDPSICKCQSCKNQNLLKQHQKALILGKSLICNGLGLFAAEKFNYYDFIGEYRGNFLLLDEESFIVEQCNLLTNQHYLFEIDEKWQVDGTHYGNNLRFINHATKQSETANCQAIVLFSEGRWRIAIIASKDISIGEELFFDYGDKFKTKWVQQFNDICSKYFNNK